MPSCAVKTSMERSKGKVFFRFPDPDESRARKALCKKWIDNLRNAKLHINTFKFSANKVVCEDHFTNDCFKDYNHEAAQSITYRKVDLKRGALPTRSILEDDRSPSKKQEHRHRFC